MSVCARNPLGRDSARGVHYCIVHRVSCVIGSREHHYTTSSAQAVYGTIYKWLTVPKSAQT